MLYYNMDLMEGLVGQDESKRYVLTPRGKTAYHLLVESEEKLVSLGVEAERHAGWLRLFDKTVMMRGLFSYLYESPKLSLPSALTVLLYGAWITYEAELSPIVFPYSEKLVFPQVFAPLLFIGAWVDINILGNLLPLVLYACILPWEKEEVKKWEG